MAKKSCGCALTVAWLRKIGAKHAAKMHAKGAFGAEWTADDWRKHMEEEERLMWPHIPSGMAAVLTADHNVFRKELDRTGKIPKDLMEAHSSLEDDLIRDLLKKGG